MDGQFLCVYLVGIGVFVNDPTAQMVAPIFNDEGFGEFLALAVSESSLSLAGRHQEGAVTGWKGNFQPLADIVLDGRTGTPGSSPFLDPDPFFKFKSGHIQNFWPIRKYLPSLLSTTWRVRDRRCGRRTTRR